MFNQLSILAAVSMGASAAPSVQGSPSRMRDSIVVGAEQRENVGTRGTQFMNDTLRPNIHVGIHWPEFAEEYALPINCNTLTGEHLHR